MKKVLFFAVSLLLVTACNNANNEKDGKKITTEQSVNGGRPCEEQCEERCVEHDNCDYHHGRDCEIRENCRDYRNGHCDTHHVRHSDCNDNRHHSYHCNDRC